MKEVNRKIIALVMLLSLTFLLVGPIVTVEGEQKETLSYYEVHDAEHEDPYFEIDIPDAKGTKTFSKVHCDVPAYVINIGGELVKMYPGAPFIGKFKGGTSYVLGRDFTYEGTMFWMTRVVYEGNKWITVMQIDRCGIYTFTESEASIHKIDGTLEFYERAQVNFTALGWPVGESVANGHGTGDLKGVKMKATMGPLIYTQETGIQWATLQGTIEGWPTHLNKPPPRADIYIEHTWRGDLIVDIGVGDPSSPIWSQRLWDGEGGSADDLDLTVDLWAAVAYLPPDGNQWFLKVYDRRAADQGQITEFTITYDGITYASTDPPIPVNDHVTSYAYIPS